MNNFMHEQREVNMKIRLKSDVWLGLPTLLFALVKQGSELKEHSVANRKKRKPEAYQQKVG